MKLAVFSYGSLIDEPELPDRITRRHVAWWPDHERLFNLRSRYRGCTRSEAQFSDLEVPAYTRGETRDSLVLGTRPRPGHRVAGAWLEFDEPDGSTLAAMDRREGFDPQRPDESPYHRVQTEVVLHSGAPRSAWVYVTNPAHPRCVDVDLATQAEILLHATPVATSPGHPRGAQYLLPLIRFLRDHGLRDAGMEALVRAMEAGVGPMPAHFWSGVGHGEGWSEP